MFKCSTFEELAPSFVLTKDKHHEELDMEPAEVIEKTVSASAQIESNLDKTLQKHHLCNVWARR